MEQLVLELNGLFHGGGFTQLVTQTVVAVDAIVVFGVMTGIVVGPALKYTMGWRTPAVRGVVGIDLSTDGAAGYDLEPPSSGSDASGVLVW